MKRLPTLERYNQIIWAVIGSGVVLITIAAGLIILAALTFKLINSHQRGVSVTLIDQQAPADGQPSVQYNFCAPEKAYHSKYQYIRVVSNTFVVHKELKKEKSIYSYGETLYDTCQGYGNSNRSSLVNVLIRNPESNESHLLLAKNGVIDSIEYPHAPNESGSEEDSSHFPPAGSIYLEAVFSDANGDGVIDRHDDSGAYLVDIDGRNLQRITPEKSRVVAKSYDLNRDVLTLQLLQDANGDQRLDEQDLNTLVEVEVSKRKLLGEVLTTTLLNTLMKSAEPTTPGKEQPR